MLSQWLCIVLCCSYMMRRAFMGGTPQESAALFDHLLCRVPDLAADLTSICIGAVEAREYDLLRRVVVNGGLTDARWDGPRFVQALLTRTAPLPATLYQSKSSRDATVESLPMMTSLGELHRDALAAPHSLWTTLVRA